MDIWHRLQQSAVDSSTVGQRVFTPAYAAKQGHFELWQYANWASGH